MSEDAKPYVIQPQDTVLSIALLHDIEDPRLILNHEKNKEMFQENKRDPHMLAPGEVLYIPPAPAPTASVSPKTTNSFKATIPKVHIHLEFESEKGPLINEEFVIEAPVVLTTARQRDLKEPLKGNLDGAGRLSLEVPAMIGSFVIQFPKRKTEHEVFVGGLDPLDTETGLGARLMHLGFLPLDQRLKDPFIFETEKSQERTVVSFQEAFALEKTGFADGTTINELKKAHGC